MTTHTTRTARPGMIREVLGDILGLACLCLLIAGTVMAASAFTAAETHHVITD